MEKYKQLENIVSKDRIKYNVSMKNYTTVKVGGPCDAIIFPNSIDEIKEIVSYCKKQNLKFYIIGNGSNLLVKDEGIHALLIKINSKFSDVKIDGDTIITMAGATMPYVSQIAKKNSLCGFEFACGIPGTIGGGIKMNAGAYNGQISDILEDVTYIDDKLNIKKISNKDCMFGYRKSIFIDNPEYIILSATFRLNKGSKEEIENKMKENSKLRKEKQPLEYPNFGSVFKRPKGYFVGKLISDAGLRGYKIGGAQVSTKHTGFIINTGNATCNDIIELIKHIQSTVYDKFNVKLETEVIIIGGE